MSILNKTVTVFLIFCLQGCKFYQPFSPLPVSITLRAPESSNLKSGKQISGLVRDGAGRPLAGGEVEATCRDSGKEFKAVSDGAGKFVLDSLPEGEYDVEVKSPGMAPVEMERIDLVGKSGRRCR